MKVAILIPGQSRFFRNNNSILELKSQYNADIYIHTWHRLNEEELYTSPYCQIMDPFKITNNDVDDYISMYSPKKYTIEKELTEEYIDKFLIPRVITEKTSSTITKFNMYRYLYSLNKCVEMLDDSYDLFIITRSDMISIRLPQLEENSFFVPMVQSDMRNGINNPHYYIDSMLLTIPTKYISEYCDLINKMDFYYDKGYDYNFDEMFFAHFKETGLLDIMTQKRTNEFYFEIRRDEFDQKKHRLW